MEQGGGVWAVIAVFTPFVAAVAIGLTPRLSEFWSFLASLATVVGVAMLLSGTLAGEAVEVTLVQVVPGLALRLRVDALGLTFALLASGLWVLSTLYSTGYVRANNLKHRPRYFACFAASIGAAIGVALAGNVLTFLLFYEALTLATYPLVLHKETPEAVSAARRYLVYALSGGVLLTIATVWTWAIAGTLEFVPGGFMHSVAGSSALGPLFLLYMVGAGVKAAIMPLHAWLPAAMVAPSPVSALLHAVAVVKAGVFACIRVLNFVFGPHSLSQTNWTNVVLAVCAATIVIGSLLALRQDNLKRRLAYSTIVHLSYVVFGAALLTPYGLTGAIFHMANHGLAKITLFFCAGAIYATAHLERVSELRGLARRMPWTFAAFTIASLALVGIPGLSGFISKMQLARGTLDAQHYLYAGVLLGASLLTAAYLLPIVRIAYLEEPEELPDGQHHEPVKEARLAMVIPLMGTAALVVIFGLWPLAINVQHGLAALATQRVFGVVP
jgi:multicomponent Na+:H+ antiporter subunit D